MSIWVVLSSDREVVTNDKIEITPFPSKDAARRHIADTVRRNFNLGDSQVREQLQAFETNPAATRFCYGPYDYAIREIKTGSEAPSKVWAILDGSHILATFTNKRAAGAALDDLSLRARYSDLQIKEVLHDPSMHTLRQ
jgi:hypothetical protein